MDYKEAGVDIEKGDTFVKNIAGMVRLAALSEVRQLFADCVDNIVVASGFRGLQICRQCCIEIRTKIC